MVRSLRRDIDASGRQLRFGFLKDETALALPIPTRRVLQLRKERDLLIAKVQRKLQARDQLDASVQAAATLLGARLSPALHELRELGSGLRREFQSLLQTKLSASARTTVRSIFLALEDTGVLGAPSDEEDAEDERRAVRDEDDFDLDAALDGDDFDSDDELDDLDDLDDDDLDDDDLDDDDSPAGRARSTDAENSLDPEDEQPESTKQSVNQRGKGRAAARGAGKTGRAASQSQSKSDAASKGRKKGKAKTKPSDADSEHAAPEAASAQLPNDIQLKTLFRQLASMLHPDRASDATDRTLRTEAMKQLTQAYGKANLASMLAVQQAWEAHGRVAALSRDSGSLEELLTTVKQLREQLREVEHEMREIRRDSPLADMGFRHEPGADPAPLVDRLVADVTRERDHLAKIKDLVIAFRQGRIKLADFKSGPFGLDRR